MALAPPGPARSNESTGTGEAARDDNPFNTGESMTEIKRSGSFSTRRSYFTAA